jgi:hypothetical protein
VAEIEHVTVFLRSDYGLQNRKEIGTATYFCCCFRLLGFYFIHQLKKLPRSGSAIFIFAILFLLFLRPIGLTTSLVFS